MVDKLVERKQRETAALSGKKTETVSDTELFGMLGGAMGVK